MMEPWQIGSGGADNSWAGSSGGGGFDGGGGGGFSEPGGIFDWSFNGGPSGDAVWRSLGIVPMSAEDGPRAALAERNAQRQTNAGLRDFIDTWEMATGRDITTVNRTETSTRTTAPGTVTQITDEARTLWQALTGWQYFWPAVIVIAGLLIMRKGKRR
jgi:hypothetical protein